VYHLLHGFRELGIERDNFAAFLFSVGGEGDGLGKGTGLVSGRPYHDHRAMIFLDDDLGATADLLENGVDVADEFCFGDVEDGHLL